MLLLLFSCVQLFGTPQTVAHQAPLCMKCLRQQYWSGLPLPTPGAPPDPGIEPVSPVLAGRFFTIEPPRKPSYIVLYCKRFKILFTQIIYKKANKK